MCFLLSWENLLTHMLPGAVSKSFKKILCAHHTQSYSIFNYLMYFCTHVLFYTLFITGNSLVDNENSIIILFFFLQKIFYFRFVFAESFSFYLSLPKPSVTSFEKPSDTVWIHATCLVVLKRGKGWLLKVFIQTTDEQNDNWRWLC